MDTVTGFSISPTHINAVRIETQDFSVVNSVSCALPPATISHDAKFVLDSSKLTSLLLQLMPDLGHPEFSEPVFLSVYSPYLDMHTGHVITIDQLKGELLQKTFGSTVFEQPVMPIIQDSLLWQHGENASLVYSFLEADAVEQYCKAFYEAGLKVASIDLMPWAILRSMGASGVLDALIRKIGLSRYWGCFGICGSQTWVTLWQGPAFKGVRTFTTPSDPNTWASEILAILQLTENTEISFWFCWQEEGLELPVNPLKLNLRAPIQPAVVGPIYQMPSHKISLPALGTALKAEFAFPMGWDFLADPATQELQADLMMVPYVNYQPVFPRLLQRVGLVCLISTLMATCYAGWLNFQGKQQLNAQVQLLSHEQESATHQNQLFVDTLKRLSQDTSSEVQIQFIQINSVGLLNLKGLSYAQPPVESYIEKLTHSSSSPIQVEKQQLKIIPPSDSPESLLHFEFSGKVQPAKGKAS